MGTADDSLVHSPGYLVGISEEESLRDELPVEPVGCPSGDVVQPPKESIV
jgi:hypothetical protein